MLEQRYLGKLCPYSQECPVYLGKTKVKGMNSFLIKNVFCNRNYKGWKNCKRFQLAEEKKEISATTTPYKID